MIANVNHKLKAGALYYAILVSFLVALLSGVLLINVRYHHFHTLALLQQQRLERNVNSSLVLAAEKPDLLQIGQSKTIDLFDDGVDEVMLTKRLWGAYVLIKSEATWRRISHTAFELCGSDIFTEEPVALYLADKERYLSVSGNTVIKGNCYLPKLGIRRAYIEGMSFTGDELVQGKMQVSKAALPSLEESVIAINQEYLTNSNFTSDSVLSLALLMKSDSFSNSFANKTVLFYANQWLNLSQKKLNGNIRIVSAKGVTLGGNTKLQDVIVYAPNIEVLSGFDGNAQLFGRDSILVREGARLRYPSFMALVDASIAKPLIVMEKESSIAGDIFISSKKNTTDIQPECRLEEHTAVNGQIYCDGKLQIKGKINGRVYSNGFILRTPSSIYENHLLNAIIDFPALSRYYAGSVFLKTADRYKAIKWVY